MDWKVKQRKKEKKDNEITLQRRSNYFKQKIDSIDFSKKKDNDKDLNYKVTSMILDTDSPLPIVK
jgi:hypothetical protein